MFSIQWRNMYFIYEWEIHKAKQYDHHKVIPHATVVFSFNFQNVKIELPQQTYLKWQHIRKTKQNWHPTTLSPETVSLVKNQITIIIAVCKFEKGRRQKHTHEVLV
jgi:hypothetical protein